jgi:hypothetical protein
VQRLQASGKKWASLTSQDNIPLLALDAEAFFRGLFFDGEGFNPHHYCHRPLVITDPTLSFAKLLPQFRVHAAHAEDDVIDHDLFLLWAEEKRIITGSDILGRLMRGIVQRTETP